MPWDSSSQVHFSQMKHIVHHWEALLLFFPLKMYLFILTVLGLRCCVGFLQLQGAGATSFGAQASHCGGFSCFGAWAPELRFQQLQLTGSIGSGALVQFLWWTSLVASQHMGSSQTRGQTHVPCIGRRILNQWTRRISTNGPGGNPRNCLTEKKGTRSPSNGGNSGIRSVCIYSPRSG